MIGNQPEGTLPGVVFVAQAHKGLSVTYNGQPARLAVLTADGQIVAEGPQVAKEAENVVRNCIHNFWEGLGHLKVFSAPLTVVRPSHTDVMD